MRKWASKTPKPEENAKTISPVSNSWVAIFKNAEFWVNISIFSYWKLSLVFIINGNSILFKFHINIVRKVESIIRCINFARSSRVSKNPAALLNNEVGEWKTKTRFSYDG